MKMAVIGAGGVGGYYGALLALAGNEVHFVARGPHLEAMRHSGLQVRSILGDFRVQPVLATDQPAAIGTVDLALFCTKTFDTLAAARRSAPLVGRDTTVLSLQNGVEAAEQLGRMLGPEHVLAGATWVSSSIESPGVIRHVSDSRRVVLGELDGRASRRLLEIQRHFAEAGIVTEISSNIEAVLWTKLVFIAAVAGVGSLTRLPIGAYREVVETRQLLLGMMSEAAAVAAALGVRCEADAVDRALAYLDSIRPEIKASMQLDIEAGHPSELEALIGVIVRKGRQKRVPTPITAAIHALLIPVERQAH